MIPDTLEKLLRAIDRRNEKELKRLKWENEILARLVANPCRKRISIQLVTDQAATFRPRKKR